MTLHSALGEQVVTSTEKCGLQPALHATSSHTHTDICNSRHLVNNTKYTIRICIVYYEGIDLMRMGRKFLGAQLDLKHNHGNDGVFVRIPHFRRSS